MCLKWILYLYEGPLCVTVVKCRVLMPKICVVDLLSPYWIFLGNVLWHDRILCGSVVKNRLVIKRCQDRSLLEASDFSWSFHGQVTSGPQPTTDETEKFHKYVICNSDMFRMAQILNQTTRYKSLSI